MVDGINGNGSGKEWVKINDTTTDKEYLNALDKKISSILGGKETISVDKLRKNSLFSNLSGDAEKRFNDIAKMDGNSKTLSADELRVLYALADATLEDNKFKFDTNFEIDAHSGLIQATDKEINTMIKNLVRNDAVRKRIETIDASKYDRTKPFADKVQSSDIDEVMIAMQDKLSAGINKATGKPLSLGQAIPLFHKYIRDNGSKEGCRAFTEETGIECTSYGLHKSGLARFQMGDWEYEPNAKELGGIITNRKTGETLQIQPAIWRNTTTHTIPASDGYYTYIRSYDDGNGTELQFTYGDDENIAPTGANITVNGQTKTVDYNQKLRVDPGIYNFVEE